MARRGAKKIIWPEVSFGIESNPYRTAREVIDWRLPGESIFKRKKPLARATMARIAAGLRKYGGKNAEPFLIMMYGSNDARSIYRPMPTITAGGQHIGLCKPFLTHITHTGGDRVHNIDDPVPTITCAHRGEMALVEPFLVRYHGNHPGDNDSERRTHSLNKPLPTLDTSNRYALCEPFIAIMKGNSKTRDIDSPLPTITTNPHLYFCEPFITMYYGRSKASSVDEPLDTITTRDRFGLVEPCVDGNTVYDIRFRMLQPHELAAAMSFGKDYQFAGNKTDKVRQIGNAVPVRTATELCRQLLAS
jgi:DNA (cytosine-5)-methyltransferase 1